MAVLSAENVWREVAVEGAGLIIDGDAYYRAFHAAASRARRSILMSGWQFDSDVALLRGEAAQGVELPVTMLKLLNRLCEDRPELEVRLLAWDFHAVFAIEREWLQTVIFDWTTNERLHFQFDGHHAPGGSHHQKFVVIDGELSFLGGLDVCDHRWDDRRHLAVNPQRMSRGAPHKPFHDVQAYLVGREAGAALTGLFMDRWTAAGGAPFTAGAPDERGFADHVPGDAIALPVDRVALSRTDPLAGCREIERQYVEAIAAAERTIYIETQYLSSRVVGDALAERLRGRGGLETVIVLNIRGENIKEQVAVGLAQSKVLGRLRAAAAEGGNALGVYYVVPDGAGEAQATYIHSKIMVVDDRLLVVGSANLTNRSLGVDTELNASFEGGGALGEAIRGVRRGLLAEHCGCGEPPETVKELDARAASGEVRLRLHPSPTKGEQALLEVVDPHALPWDPASPEGQEEQERTLFVGGVGALWRRLFDGDQSPQPT